MFLGVDGGGTTTKLCLVGTSGEILSQTRTSGISYLSTGVATMTRVLADGVRTVCEQAGIAPADVSYAFFGMPGYGEASGDIPLLDAAPRPVLGHDRYRCGNDMICGWAGSLGASDGINVISGTGSMAYGQRAGRELRVGGWSELFGDEGSAYWIAVRGLSAFSRMCDGRQAEGPLADALRHRLSLPADLDLIDLVVNRWRGDRARIAALCPLVVEAAGQGDATAGAVLGEAARELALLADTARRRLGYTGDERVPVSWSGGVFSEPPILDAFTRELAALHGGYDLRRPLLPPAAGAALQAARLSGRPLAPPAVERLRAAQPR